MILEHRDLQDRLVRAERMVQTARLALRVAQDLKEPQENLDRLGQLVLKAHREKLEVLALLEV